MHYQLGEFSPSSVHGTRAFTGKTSSRIIHYSYKLLDGLCSTDANADTATNYSLNYAALTRMPKQSRKTGTTMYKLMMERQCAK
jgi:hypothetical protein